jgi:hypothetical protein
MFGLNGLISNGASPVCEIERNLQIGIDGELVQCGNACYHSVQEVLRARGRECQLITNRNAIGYRYYAQKTYRYWRSKTAAYGFEIFVINTQFTSKSQNEKIMRN